MSANRPARYCRCGTRLARDNTASHCAPCQAKARDLMLRSPDVSEDFWDTEQFRDAFAAQHIGQVSRAYRRHPNHIAAYGKDGIPQDTVGRWLGLTQAQVSRIESGPAVKHLDSLTHWAKTLRIPGYLLWFKLAGESVPHEERVHVVQPTSIAIPLQPRPQPTMSAASFGLSLLGNGLLATGEAYTSVMQSFRAADRQVGGGHLYATVVKYLQAEIAPRLFGVDHDSDGRLVFTAAAALTEMAGWMAHDAGRDQAAEQHFARSLDLVKVGGDRQLGVHVLASMSHLAHHRGSPGDAIQLARRGREALARGPRQPELEARLLAMQARGFAVLRRAEECTALLVRAEGALTATPDDARSQWISHFDEASLASEAARCFRELADHQEAQRQAERIIQLRPSDRTRSRAFGQLLLVTVLIAQGRPDEACALAQEVLDATQQLGSYLVIQQLLDLKQLLEPHQGSREVSAFLGCLEEALRERVWLYQWLNRDGHSQATAPGGHGE
jgi:tetratricopeptide (TPR) repeat protein